MTENILAFSAPRQSLHKWLRAISDPYIGAETQPIIIGWYQSSYSRKDQNKYGQFRLQYGGRSWTFTANSFGSGYSGRQPAYQARLEKLAVVLAEQKWDEMALSLLPKSAKNFAEDNKNKPVEMFLYIAGENSRFGVRDLETKEVKYFSVDAGGLTASDLTQNVWFDAWPSQTKIKVFPPFERLKTFQTKTVESLNEKVKWWYNSPLMPEGEAKDYLGNLLRSYLQRLSKIGASVAIATSPHRFDDACGQDDWLAAFVDGEIWEQGHYFAPPENKLALAPPKLHEAIGLLSDAVKSDIRQRFAQYIGTSAISPDCMFLSADERGYLIAFSVSNGGGGPVYSIDKETGLPTLVGVAPRLDWQFNEFNGVMRDGEYVTQPKEHIVEFIPLEKWISECVNNENLPYDYPSLGEV